MKDAGRGINAASFEVLLFDIEKGCYRHGFRKNIDVAVSVVKQWAEDVAVELPCYIDTSQSAPVFFWIA